MMVTLHLTDGRKITKESTKLKFITDPEGWILHGEQIVEEGCITVNWCNVVDMRPAEDDEIEHARIHGW